MHRAAVQRILGLLLMVFSVTMLPPVGVAWYYGDGGLVPFALAFFWTLSIGAALWWPVRRLHQEMRVRDGFVVVVMFWVVLGLSGAFPFFFSNTPVMSFTDAVFESFSGLTTTGATVLRGLDHLPHAILYYRQQLQWLGGMGIIVLAIAILPMFGVGGMQLYRAETPGPMKDQKLTPRIAETAKGLWYIYLALTVFCAVAFYLAGMTVFDAIGHAFSTISTGGFSTHDRSIGYFENGMVEFVAAVFMLLAGVNFALHFVAWSGLSLAPYREDAEFRAYLRGLVLIAALASGYFYITGTFDNPGAALHHGVFQAISMATTTGHTTGDYLVWPSVMPVILLLVSFIGGCAGSTGGGMKVIRVLLLFKQGTREIVRLIHPNVERPVRVGDTSLPERVVESVWGFFSLYALSFSLLSIVLAASGVDLVTSFSAIAACMNNLGPGLAGIGSHYGDLPDFAKWVLVFAMLLGRLEVFTLLVLFTPAFWRK